MKRERQLSLSSRKFTSLPPVTLKSTCQDYLFGFLFAIFVGTTASGEMQNVLYISKAIVERWYTWIGDFTIFSLKACLFCEGTSEILQTP